MNWRGMQKVREKGNGKREKERERKIYKEAKEEIRKVMRNKNKKTVKTGETVKSENITREKIAVKN